MSLIRKVKYLLKKISSLTDYVPVLEKRLPKYPFGKNLNGHQNQYIKLHQKGILNLNDEILDFQNSSGFSVDNEWFNHLTLFTQTCIKKSELNFNHGRLLYSSLSKYINNNFKNKNDSLVILEEEVSKILFIQGWTNSLIGRLGLSRINFAFLDAQHTKNDVLKEFNFVYKKQIKGDIIVFDDVTPGQFDGVCDALEIIESQYPYKVNRFASDPKRGYAIATRE